MTQRPENNTQLDPAMMVRNVRDVWLDGWSRIMIQAVNTEAYSQITGMMLNTYLTASSPLRQAVEQVAMQLLPQLNLPSRDDVLRLADRLTNIELRLDDMDARLFEMQQKGVPTINGLLKEERS